MLKTIEIISFYIGKRILKLKWEKESAKMMKQSDIKDKSLTAGSGQAFVPWWMTAIPFVRLR
jgi:hypothetical protein